MIARQGSVREWHFSHEARQGSTEDVCEYSALVSIRLMAHQVLSRADKMRVPSGPLETRSPGRQVTLDSIRVDTDFEGQKVDALALVKGIPLVLYMTHKTRPVPAALLMPADQKAGVLSIDLPSLWRRTQETSGNEFDSDTFARALIYEVTPKRWAYHPAQNTQPPISTEVPRQSARRIQEAITTKEPSRPHVGVQDDSPLLSRFRCSQCGATWFAGNSEAGARRCQVCARDAGVRIS